MNAFFPSFWDVLACIWMGALWSIKVAVYPRRSGFFLNMLWAFDWILN